MLREKERENMPNEPKKRRGDRRDATMVRDLDALHVIMPYVFLNRTDSEVYSNEDYDITELLSFIKKENELHPEYKTTMFHAVLTAFARVVYSRPLLNRFIANRRLYQRDKLTFSFMAKKHFTDRSEESLITMEIKPEMGLREISREIVGDVKVAREGASSSTEDTMDIFKKLPRPVLTFVMWLCRVMAEKDTIPKAFIDGDVSFSSVLLTNLGSIKAGSVYHHLSNWGTNSIIGAIGTIHKKPQYNDDGSYVMRDVVDLGITLDERIADGFYFARSMKLLQWLLSNPEELLKPASEEIKEII